MKKKATKHNKDLVIYQADNGSIELRGDFNDQTIWATQKQLGEVFKVDVRTVNEHLINIFKTKELDEKSVIRNFRITASDGKTYDTKHYNLDAIISVGYRVNSKTATKFRQWATKTLKQHITKGFTINQKRLKQNHKEFLDNVERIQALLPEHVMLDPKAVLELVKEFSSTWTALDAYDKDSLRKIEATKKSVKVNSQELIDAISTLRQELLKKKEATAIFAQERNKGSIEGVIGNVMQEFGGKPVYPSLEEKAANLLYFMVKNHPFVDGNKRSGAFAFIWFLRKAQLKGSKNINSSALTALTLLIAESKPSTKEQIVALVTNLLSIKKLAK